MSAATRTLAWQQQSLLDALFVRPGGDSQRTADDPLQGLLDAQHEQFVRGLAAYRSNGHAIAERSLLAAYPVIAAMLGPQSFALLARDLWHTHPPRSGDLAQWGDALPAFLQASDPLADAPYLADVARTEWALHRAAGAPDAVPDLPSFSRLASEDPQGLSLTLTPGVTVVASNYPVVSLVNAHLQDTPRLDDAARRLREGVGERALVWRQGLRPRLALISPAAAALVLALMDGADLPTALDTACAVEDPSEPFDFSAWLTAAVTDGLLIGVHRLAAPHPP